MVSGSRQWRWFVISTLQTANSPSAPLCLRGDAGVWESREEDAGEFEFTVALREWRERVGAQVELSLDFPSFCSVK